MTTPEHFDVVVVGAGISGIGAAHHLGAMSPDRSYVILEGRDDLGGTWDLFRYPGVRSDSDMHTLGYSFKPWKAEMSIADGPAILEYLNETVDEYDIRGRIRFRTLVERAEWSSEDAALYETVKAVGMELCPALGISIPVGKDSLSMRTQWKEIRMDVL